MTTMPLATSVRGRRATKTGSEGEDTREATPTPLRLNAVTSLSMIYLREFERTHSTMRGKVRIARKAGHMLRMHWAHVGCETCQSELDETGA